ncbi:MAG: hypothetical protein KGS61_07550 [Verrucomicrobia bacterium]|nr:hypothetical protein [Verrucomicrobiota bacterium]
MKLADIKSSIGVPFGVWASGCIRSRALASAVVAVAQVWAVSGAPRVEVMADMLEAFAPGHAHDTLECAVRRPATAGGIQEDGLFEHPLNTRTPARVDYDLRLPACATNARLLLAFDLALSDGVKLGTGEDGVRFRVEIEGQTVFGQAVHECRWSAHAVDLTAFGGRRVRLALLVDGLQNTSYDWAVWGNPRVLYFGEGTRNQASAVPIATGALAVNYQPGQSFKIRLSALGGGQAREWQVPAEGVARARQWFAVDFSLPTAKGLEVTWEPQAALDVHSVWLGAFPPQLELVRLSVAAAVPVAGQAVPLRVEAKNSGRGALAAGGAHVELSVGAEALLSVTLPALAPGEGWRHDWQWLSPVRPGRRQVEASLVLAGESPNQRPKRWLETFAPPRSERTRSLENGRIRIEFERSDSGYAYARIFGRQGDRWTPVGVWRPLFRIVEDGLRGEEDWEVRPRRFRRWQGDGGSQGAEFVERLHDTDGVPWTLRLRIALAANEPVAQVHYEWQAAGARVLRALWGPNLYVGEGTTGEAKTWGLFPGLEYLYGAEPSSSPRDFSPSLADRRTPDSTKITVPLMAVTVGADSPMPPATVGRFFASDSLKDLGARQTVVVGPSADLTVALLWDPHQKWDGQHEFPATRFSSPNADEGMRNHRLALFLPSVPDFVAENADRAQEPYRLEAGQRLTLDAELVVAPGPGLRALNPWYRWSGGLPRPNPWPRTFEEELAVCRAGFLHTVWDARAGKWRHCIGWADTDAPGFATLLWWDAHVTRDLEGARQSRERVEMVARDMVREGGPSLLTSPAACHILRWEFPFYYGYLPEALQGLAGQIQGLIQSQRSDGGWVYESGNAQQAELGQAGDSVLGTCAVRASLLARYARITGDSAARAAAERALGFMENFRVPRGGQTWECPMYEPDILAAAYAVAADCDAFEATADPRWLHDAVYWAETGVPFIYQWSMPGRSMMLGATIPVFGSTFYTHTWLAVPVQWCGLVYAYHVFHLAEILEGTKAVAATGSPLPLALDFSPADWKRVVELITVSAMNQQFARGDRIGAYPDSVSRFEHPNPPFINPEDILDNVLLLRGQDPDIKTVRLTRGGRTVVISSGARITDARVTNKGVRFRLRYFEGESSHSLVAGLRPAAVRVAGRALGQLDHPMRRETGWWWDQASGRVYMTTPQSAEAVEVEIEAAD